MWGNYSTDVEEVIIIRVSNKGYPKSSYHLVIPNYTSVVSLAISECITKQVLESIILPVHSRSIKVECFNFYKSKGDPHILGGIWVVKGFVLVI